mmetsp:Transcript_20235/g.64644  ORF Transcript_20235/g.64644 Transcript_20235/m.64644 type:complete len:235 (+) Transcript_20235:151-855(+)
MCGGSTERSPAGLHDLEDPGEGLLRLAHALEGGVEVRRVCALASPECGLSRVVVARQVRGAVGRSERLLQLLARRLVRLEAVFRHALQQRGPLEERAHPAERRLGRRAEHLAHLNARALTHGDGCATLGRARRLRQQPLFVLGREEFAPHLAVPAVNGQILPMRLELADEAVSAAKPLHLFGGGGRQKERSGQQRGQPQRCPAASGMRRKGRGGLVQQQQQRHRHISGVRAYFL